MTDLSPAARVVLAAANGACCYGPDDCLNESRRIAAAALRAAADALVANEYWDKYPAIYYRKKLLATADELEAQ